ncbi:MAG: hypothetical protein Q8O23_00425 [Gallionella sp.]|nr:hypothetical protein [Gallionella sp.]
MKYLAEAPRYLKNMHERGQEGQAKELLGSILSDPEMSIVWTHLARQIKEGIEWLRLWQEIKNAIFVANPKRKPKRVSEEAADLEWIAIRAEELARVIEIERGVGYKGFFNFACHQFCPDDVMKINGIPGWSGLDSMEQYARASEVITTWPRMSELLDGLAARARERAGQCKTKRVVLKDKGRWSETMFSRQLHSHLSLYQWEKRDAIFATIADIANMAIDAKLLKTEHAEHISREFVQDAVAKPKRRTTGVKKPALKPPK